MGSIFKGIDYWARCLKHGGVYRKTGVCRGRKFAKVAILRWAIESVDVSDGSYRMCEVYGLNTN